MLFLGNILGYVSIGPSSTRSTPCAISNGSFDWLLGKCISLLVGCGCWLSLGEIRL